MSAAWGSRVVHAAERIYAAVLRRVGVDGHTGADMRSTFAELVRREYGARGLPGVVRRTAAEVVDVVVKGRGLRRMGPGRRRRGALTQVVAHALRGVRRRPGHSLAFVATMGAGIGVNAAMVVVVGAAALRPLPYRSPERLAQVWSLDPASGRDGPSIPAADFVAWREHGDLFEDFEGFGAEHPVVLSGDGEPRQIFVSRVTTGLFAQLGVRPRVGRGFTVEDGLPGGPHVVMLSHGLWVAAYGADPEIVGRVVRLDDEPATVVGVMPPRFAFPHGEAEAWLPASTTPSGLEAAGALTGFVHLRPGLTRDEAEERLTTRLKEAAGAGTPARLPMLVDLSLLRTPEVIRQRLILLLGAVAFVLVIATANVLSLGVAEALRRRRELAVMATLGAGRGRLIGQLTAESLLLCLGGAAVGLGLAHLALRGFVPLIPERLNLNTGGRALTLWPDGVLLSVGAALAAAPIVGGLTALLARVGGTGALSRNASGPDRLGGRLQHGLIAAQVALALVLTSGAGLLLGSFARLATADPVVRADRVLLATVRLPRARYPTASHRETAVGSLTDALAGLPGVRSIGVTTSPLPLGRGHFRARVEAEDGGTVAVEDFLPWHEVGPGFFETLGIAILRGRPLEPADDGQPVAIVNEVLAERLWPDASALGRRFRTDPEGPWLTVVGVAQDVPQIGPRDPWGQGMEYYAGLPAERGTAWTFVMETRDEPGALADAVRQAIWSVDPQQPIERVESYRGALERGLETDRFYATLLTTFAALASLLAAVGIHAVVSRVVLSRRREIGIRAALGADRLGILRAAMAPGLLAVAGGVVTGVAASLGSTRVLESLLFGMRPRDPLVLGLDALVVLLIAGIAMLIPARRALAVEPATAMHSE